MYIPDANGMKVELIDHMGDDYTIVNAARVSFGKHVAAEEYHSIGYGSRQHVTTNVPVVADKDERLIKYLAEHNHIIPFAHASLQFYIKAPIFVARQLGKHQVGLAWNEISRRYVDTNVECWTTREWRERAENKKQGSKDTLVQDPHNDMAIDYVYNDAVRHAIDSYNLMLAKGVCPEQARAVLPQSMFTEWYWSGSLLAFARVCNLRLDEHAQAEVRYIAAEISLQASRLFPVCWKYLTKKEDTDGTNQS
jgi:thymidylate synthase (FAD)